jgi:VTC domain
MRHEVKYLVPDSARPWLRRHVARYTGRDPHATEDGFYTVRSIYLDTSRGAMYVDKLEGTRKRLKVRVRGYGDVNLTSPASLELKRKVGATAWKRRAHLPLGEVEDWLRGNGVHSKLDDEDAARTFRYFVLRHSLKPAVLVVYDREAFEGVHDPTLRVTFDRNLRGRFISRLSRLGAEAPVKVYNRHFILEVKFDYHFPSWLKPVLAELGLQRKALSKYALTMDACARATHGRRASFSGGRVLRPGLLQTSF